MVSANNFCQKDMLIKVTTLGCGSTGVCQVKKKQLGSGRNRSGSSIHDPEKNLLRNYWTITFHKIIIQNTNYRKYTLCFQFSFFVRFSWGSGSKKILRIRNTIQDVCVVRPSHLAEAEGGRVAERVGRGRVGRPAAAAVVAGQGAGWAGRRAEPPASYSDVPSSKYCF